MLLRVPCSNSERMGPTLCAPAQSLMAHSPLPWQCFSMAGSSTFPSGGWMVGATMPWAGRAGTTRSCSPPWLPWSGTTQSTRCPLWTDTAVAVSSPACSSPPSPDAMADCTQPPLAPCSLLLAGAILGCLALASPKSPPFQTLPTPLPQSLQAWMRGFGKGCLEAARAPETPPHVHLEPGTALPCCISKDWKQASRSVPIPSPQAWLCLHCLLEPPKLLWMKASPGKLSLRETARGTAWTQRESFHILSGT